MKEFQNQNLKIKSYLQFQKIKKFKIKNFLKNKRLNYFEGSDKNVLDRYYKCAKK